MTSGERAVWAAVYAAERNLGKSVTDSAKRAAWEVKNLRTLQVHARSSHVPRVNVDDDERAMLDDMLSTGSDR